MAVNTSEPVVYLYASSFLLGIKRISFDRSRNRIVNYKYTQWIDNNNTFEHRCVFIGRWHTVFSWHANKLYCRGTGKGDVCHKMTFCCERRASGRIKRVPIILTRVFKSGGETGRDAGLLAVLRSAFYKKQHKNIKPKRLKAFIHLCARKAGYSSSVQPGFCSECQIYCRISTPMLSGIARHGYLWENCVRTHYMNTAIIALSHRNIHCSMVFYKLHPELSI